ncbi:MAG: hypothetical protein K2L99_01290, partial [Muribaculaceae bacterium]|nr:hypothetical protein [Muribaculaceae bacterium]
GSDDTRTHHGASLQFIGNHTIVFSFFMIEGSPYRDTPREASRTVCKIRSMNRAFGYNCQSAICEGFIHNRAFEGAIVDIPWSIVS